MLGWKRGFISTLSQYNNVCESNVSIGFSLFDFEFIIWVIYLSRLHLGEILKIKTQLLKRKAYSSYNVDKS